jgi:starch synthase
MKAGLVYADMITTVSPTYAREIQRAEHGFGLDGVLRARAGRLVGILNGIDTRRWDPAHDELIPYNYGPSDFQRKRENKARLLEVTGLRGKPGVPVIGMIGRLVDQKGLDLITPIIDEFLRTHAVRMVVLGSGLPQYEQLMQALAERHPEKFAASLGFDEPLAHLIEAGADFFLMPSRYEPCGLNQMYSMRYGTVPIVRATGGLADTVEDVSPDRGTGSGVVFRDYRPEALREALERALALYARPRVFKNLVTRIMRKDFSWTRAAREYAVVYERAIAERRGILSGP